MASHETVEEEKKIMRVPTYTRKFRVGEKVILREDLGEEIPEVREVAERTFCRLIGRVLTVEKISNSIVVNTYLLSHHGCNRDWVHERRIARLGEKQ